MKYLTLFIRINKEIASRPTRYFTLVVVILFALFLEAYMHNFNIVYITLFFVFGFAGTAELVGRLNLFELDALLLTHGRSFARTPFECRIALRNRSPRPSYDLNLKLEQSETQMQRLGASEERIVAMTHTFDKRGEGVVGRLRLLSRFPLPHLYFYKFYDLSEQITVYPEPKGESIEAFFALNRSPTGERDDFDGIRRYARSDSAGMIHWPSVARGENIMSKLFIHTERSEKLVFDFLSCANDDESRLSQLCLWVLECEKKGLSYRIDFPNMQIDSATRRTDEILEHLARY